MDGPKPKTTKGVPWGDNNATPAQDEDTRREEYGDEEPEKNADERASGANPSAPQPGEGTDQLTE